MGPVYFWGSGMWIFPIIMLIITLIFVFLIFGRGGFRPPWWYDSDRYHNHDINRETPLEVLRRRYANGEITKEQFEQMKRDILS
ncbi:MAG: SHOCT domain-containing protein [Bacteroidetes bacterium]|nr:SHOCT domain-containing protein [Bacteroidota bacterium]MCL5738022.1 SHOCT domain-containing protein [Bacteroidota bacterium]